MLSFFFFRDNPRIKRRKRIAYQMNVENKKPHYQNLRKNFVSALQVNLQVPVCMIDLSHVMKVFQNN